MQRRVGNCFVLEHSNAYWDSDSCFSCVLVGGLSANKQLTTEATLPISQQPSFAGLSVRKPLSTATTEPTVSTFCFLSLFLFENWCLFFQRCSRWELRFNNAFLRQFMSENLSIRSLWLFHHIHRPLLVKQYSTSVLFMLWFLWLRSIHYFTDRTC